MQVISAAIIGALFVSTSSSHGSKNRTGYLSTGKRQLTRVGHSHARDARKPFAFSFSPSFQARNRDQSAPVPARTSFAESGGPAGDDVSFAQGDRGSDRDCFGKPPDERFQRTTRDDDARVSHRRANGGTKSEIKETLATFDTK